MSTPINHKYKWLWRENGLLDELAEDKYGNLQPLSWYIKQLSRCAKQLAEKHPIDQAYANYFGWQGEVLCEFWLRLFGHRYDLCDIEDTSEDQFTRGFDIRARSIFASELEAQIQVKMRGRSDAIFNEYDLFTFLDEAKEAEILPPYMVLMVPTSTGLKRDVLSYHKNFKQSGFHRFRIITGPVMEEEIDNLPLTEGNSGKEEFLIQFREAIFAG